MNWQTLTLTRNSAYRRRWRQQWRSREQGGEGRRWRASAQSPDRPRWRQWPRRRRRTLQRRPPRASFPCATRIALPCSWTLESLPRRNERVSLLLAGLSASGAELGYCRLRLNAGRAALGGFGIKLSLWYLMHFGPGLGYQKSMVP